MTSLGASRAALVGVVGLLLSSAAAADTEATRPPEPMAEGDDGRRTLRRFPANVLRGAVHVFDGDNLTPLLVGSTATAAGAYFDDDVAD